MFVRSLHWSCQKFQKQLLIVYGKNWPELQSAWRLCLFICVLRSETAKPWNLFAKSLPLPNWGSERWAVSAWTQSSGRGDGAPRWARTLLSEIAAEKKALLQIRKEMTRRCCRAGGPLFQISIVFIFFTALPLHIMAIRFSISRARMPRNRYKF